MYQVVNGKGIESKKGNILVKSYLKKKKKWTTFQEITTVEQDFFLMDFSSSKIEGGRQRENMYRLQRSSDWDSTIMSLTKISSKRKTIVNNTTN